MPCQQNALRRIEPAIATTSYKINKTSEFKIIFYHKMHAYNRQICSASVFTGIIISPEIFTNHASTKYYLAENYSHRAVI